jgi:uncharacterized protein
MDRREFLAGLCLCCLSGAASALPFRVDEGASWLSPCKAGLPPALREHEMVRAAWAGLDPKNVWDSHAHLLGDGQSGSGCWINPKMQSIFYPQQFLQRKFFENGACVGAGAEGDGGLDDAFVARLAQLIDEFPVGAGALLFAFDHTYAEDGNRDLPRAAFHVPNRHAFAIAKRFPGRFRAVASIHPYRSDAVDALENARASGAVAVKWLPSAMGIDPASSRCDAFYEAMARLQMPLITHAGQERAVKGAHQQHFGNPLRLRRALDHGVRVVVAHCASLGEDLDIDQGKAGRAVPSFDLFERLMQDARYEKNLFADISAMPQINRAPCFAKIVERTEWHSRLVNGSDYPLPGVMPLFSVDLFVERGWLAKSEGTLLKQIREYNPLLFDFVLKRATRVNGKRLADSVFETGPFFAIGNNENRA